MDVCPTSFSTSQRLLPSSTPTSGNWAYEDPNLIGDLIFPVDMDQTVTPAPGHFVLDVDGAPKTPDSCTWFDARTLQWAYAEAVLGPTLVRMQYPIMAANFLSLAGQPVFPFDLLLAAP